MTKASALRAACRAAALPGRDVAYDPRLLGGASWVPYISAWSGETDPDIPQQVIHRPDRVGIGYPHETVLDRDEHGVLWRSQPSRIGVGRPLFKDIHPLRQRHTMRWLLCQVCARPADRIGEGVLWLLNDFRDDWAGWPDRMANTQPPVCVPCARVSVRLCPSLRLGSVLVRTTRHPVAGVAGRVFRPGCVRPVLAGADVVAYQHPGVWWVQASQLVRELRDCTVVEWGRLS